MFFFDEQGWLSQDDAYDSTSLSGSRERFYDERECDIFRSSLSSRPRDKKQHCHLRFADVLLLKKDSEESIASIFSQKKWYFRHEWISSQDVFESMLRFHCKNWSCEDNEADAKSFFRVEIFFFQSEGHRTHCWKNGCSRVINRSWTFPVRKSWRASLIFKTWDVNRIFAVDLLLPKLAFIFVEGWLLRGQTLQAGIFLWGVFFKSMNARAVNYSENSSETM